MTQPRRQLIDLSVSKIYHCISRCVRQLSLLDGTSGKRSCGVDRKAWIEQRLKVLSESFAISVAEYAIMGNHLHILVRLNPDAISTWTEEEVFLRWLKANPQKDLDPTDQSKLSAWINKEKKKPDREKVLRNRLADLGWFMKCLKEPIAKLANAEDNCKGPFWDGRYKSIAVIDEESLLSTAVYIALNPFAANLSGRPENSKFTGLVQRLDHACIAGNSSKPMLKDTTHRGVISMPEKKVLEVVELDSWLCPLNDLSGERSVSGKTGGRPGLLRGLSLVNYLELIDYTSRLRRPGKASLDPRIPEIFQRLQLCPEQWAGRMMLLFDSNQIKGNYFSTSRHRLNLVARRRGQHRLNNIIPIAASS